MRKSIKQKILLIILVVTIINLSSVFFVDSMEEDSNIGGDFDDSASSEIVLPSTFISRGSINPSPTPPCGRTNITSVLLSHIPNSNHIISDIIKLQDITGRLFVVLTQNNSLTNTTIKDMWIYNIGNDGIFSNDDLVSYVSQITLPRYGYVGKVTGGLTTATEKLYWIDEPQLNRQNIMGCDLPACTNKAVVGTLTNYSALEIVPSTLSNGLYIHAETIEVGEQQIISCTLNQSNYDWCGLADDFYPQRIPPSIMSPLVGGSVREGGIGYEDANYRFTKFFFDINTDTSLPLPSNSLPSSIAPSILPNEGLIFLLRWGGMYNIASFDTNTGNIIRIEDTIPVSYNSPNYLLTYPIIASKVWVPFIGYELIKKTFGGNPATIFSQSVQYAQYTKRLFMLPNGQVVSADRMNNNINRLFIFSYDCTP